MTLCILLCLFINYKITSRNEFLSCAKSLDHLLQILHVPPPEMYSFCKIISYKRNVLGFK